MIFASNPEWDREVMYVQELSPVASLGKPIVWRESDPGPVPVCVTCGVEWQWTHTVRVYSLPNRQPFFAFVPRCECWKRGLEP